MKNSFSKHSFIGSLICLMSFLFTASASAQMVDGVQTPTTKQPWSDSYAVDGVCYCDSNYDHDLSHRFARVGSGLKNVIEICRAIETAMGKGPVQGRVYYNDIQCGNGPANSAPDETQCPGIPGSVNGGSQYSGPRCSEKGPTWDLVTVFGVAPTPTTTPPITNVSNNNDDGDDEDGSITNVNDSTTAEDSPDDSTSNVDTTNETSTNETNTNEIITSKTFNIEKDLVSLHHDMGPDKDDGHAATANYVISSQLGTNTILVGGTTTRGQSSNFVTGSDTLLDDVWGEWVNANADWEGSVEKVVYTWLEFIRSGGQIWVAEGGRADFTADVITALQDIDPDLDTTKYINVIQHSLVNESKSTQEDLDFVKQNTNYIKIDDGNVSGKTAKLKGYTENFIQKTMMGVYSKKWKKAFMYLDPATERLDFSDTVEFLHILGIGTDKISDVDSFIDYFSSNTNITEDTNSQEESITQAQTLTSTDCIDVDGDGWGWDGTQSCEMPGEAAAASREAHRRGDTSSTANTTSSTQNTSTGTNCIDADGDGWGWDGTKSCRASSTQTSTSTQPSTTPPAPTTAGDCVDTDGDGWGWDGSKSCRMPGAGTNVQTGQTGSSTTNSSEGTSGACVDDDGDGWGWDGTKSCRTGATTSVQNTINSGATTDTVQPVSGDCVDPDGDGWGWDGSKTCRMSGSVATTQTGSGATNSTEGTSGACVDEDGDGWGWDGTKSCRAGGSAQTSTSTPPTTPAVQTTSGDCVDADGDGWGWDGSATCIVPGGAAETNTNTEVDTSNTTSDNTSSGICYAVASTLAGAKEAFARECPNDSASSRDCDPLGDGNWGCANISFNGVLPGYDGGVTNNTQTGQNNTNITVDTNNNSNTDNFNNNDTVNTGDTSVAQGQGGIIVLQAESTGSSLGQWQRKTNIPGFTGSGHITFEGNSHMNGPATSPLNYSFRVQQAGVYQLMMRVRRFNVAGHNDYANDGYIRMSGDFTSPVSKPSTQELKSNHKIFGGQLSWAWTGINALEIGGPKYKPAYRFKAGQTYTLTLSGRSKGWSVDKIVLYHQSVNRNQAQSASSSTNVTIDEPQTTNALTQTTVVPGDLGRASSKDLIVLHYDHAPDKDDGHAVVAGRVLAKAHGFQPLIVHGAYGTNANTYVQSSINVTRAAWGNSFLNAHDNWQGAVNASFERWADVLNNGGNVWIAEGGQSDITADIVKMIKSRMPSINTKQRIFVIQHSIWNENKTTSADLSYVKNNTNYSKIDDGNRGGNRTAQLKMQSASFVNRARESEFGGAWSAAFNYLNPNTKLDFSDTVELLHILDVPVNRVANVNDFAEEYF